MMEGRIVQGRGGLYTVKDQSGQPYILRAKNRFRREGLTPLIGDEVLFSPGRLEEHGWLEEILPRRSVSLRPPVANITQVIITLAPEPQPDLLLIDKLLIFAFQQAINPMLLVNKSDLEMSLSENLKGAYQYAGVSVLAVSAATGLGLQELAAMMANHINCFAGQSGAGKSTLISKLTGLDLETGEVSRKIRRGKQTTRHISLIELSGLQVLDTPGFSLLELPVETEPEQLRELYPEFVRFQAQCRFEVCLHDKEPDCAVSGAIKTGMVDPGRLERYRQLLNMQRLKWSNRYA